MKAFVASAIAAAVVASMQPVNAHADMRTGNYQLLISGRYDFHSWIWSMSSCQDACLNVTAVPQPVAKAFEYTGTAYLTGDRYTLAVDVPDGLRCGDIYYGPVLPTHDVYSWDATSHAGSMESSFAAGCAGTPGGTYTYPFTLARM